MLKSYFPTKKSDKTKDTSFDLSNSAEGLALTILLLSLNMFCGMIE